MVCLRSHHHVLVISGECCVLRLGRLGTIKLTRGYAQKAALLLYVVTSSLGTTVTYLRWRGRYSASVDGHASE